MLSSILFWQIFALWLQKYSEQNLQFFFSAILFKLIKFWKISQNFTIKKKKTLVMLFFEKKIQKKNGKHVVTCDG
jgi:hypothetical protein